MARLQINHKRGIQEGGSKEGSCPPLPDLFTPQFFNFHKYGTKGEKSMMKS